MPYKNNKKYSKCTKDFEAAGIESKTAPKSAIFDAEVLCVCGIASKRGDFGAEALWKYKFATKSAIFDADLGRSVRITALVGAAGA